MPVFIDYHQQRGARQRPESAPDGGGPRRGDSGRRGERDRGPRQAEPGGGLAPRPRLDGRYLALAPRPTEPLLAQELRLLPGVTDVQELSGAVAFRGDRAALYRANLWLRCATRVLVPLCDVPCDGPADLYDAAVRLRWEDHLTQTGSLMVSAHGEGPGLNNGVFIAQRVKDAVVDRLRSRGGARPSVDLRQPDLRINVQLYQEAGATRCALALDSSGAPLHQRGYRSGSGAAPLKETLAAALVAAAQVPAAVAAPPNIVDLCCGSGTLLIEAGLRLLRRAPGLQRTFGFQRWRDFDARLWQDLQQEARDLALPLPSAPFLFGSDSDAAVLALAEQGARRAGLDGVARWTRADLADAVPPPGPAGIVLCNPPYGERLGEEAALVPLYRALGDTLKRRFKGYTAHVFTASMPLSRQIGLRPRSRQVFFNGPLEGRLLRFDLF